MSFKTIVSGELPLASDVNQYLNAFSGLADVGNLSLCPKQIVPTHTLGIGVLSGGVLTGTFSWLIVAITGYNQSDGTHVVSGFANIDSNSTTLTSQKGSLYAIPVGTAGCIGRAIYRTTAADSNPAHAKYDGIIWDNTTTTFIDNVADASLGVGMPTVTGVAIPSTIPATNTTGTSMTGQGITKWIGSLGLSGTFAVPDSADTTVIFDTSEFGGGATLANFVSDYTSFVVPDYGFLSAMITAKVTYSGTTGSQLRLMLYRRRSSVSSLIDIDYALGSSSIDVKCSKLIPIIAGDEFYIQAYQNSGSPATIYTVSTHFDCMLF